LTAETFAMRRERTNTHMNHTLLKLPTVEELLSNPYVLRDVLSIYKGILTEEKGLHEINCPECSYYDKACKKSYWIKMSIQELGYAIEQLNREVKAG
jgi:hypothetical protein